MTEYTSINRYIGHVRDEITERDAEQVAERLNELGWEKVVRCRDCRNFATDKLGDYCTLFDFEDVKGMGDKFCAWGERRGA